MFFTSLELARFHEGCSCPGCAATVSSMQQTLIHIGVTITTAILPTSFNVEVVRESTLDLFSNRAIHRALGGFSKPRSSNHGHAGDLWATAMPILPMSHPLSMAPRCVLPRHAPLTGLCAKRTASASARSKNSLVPLLDQGSRLGRRRRSHHNQQMETMAVPRCATACA